MLKHEGTPVAKLHNWSAMLPLLRLHGLTVDADSKVLLVAGLETTRAGQGRLTLAKGRLRHGTTSDRS